MTETPEPNEEDRAKARLIVEGSEGVFAPETVDFWAQGIAIARTGGDVRAWLHEQAQAGRAKAIGL